MVTSEQTQVGMPLDEFIRLNDEQPFELINGERKGKMPTVLGHSKSIRTLFRQLDTHVQVNNLGEVFSETTFVLPGTNLSDWVTGSRIPDIMFYAGNRVDEYEAAMPDPESHPLALVPDFVIEVISPNDRFSDIDEKIDAYLQDGVQLIWIIDPQRRKVIVHAPDMEQPHYVVGDATLSAGDVIPGFEIALSKLFGSQG